MKYKNEDKIDIFTATSYMIFPLILAFSVIIFIQIAEPELIDTKYINMITIATIGFTICELLKAIVLYNEAKIELINANNEEDFRRLGFIKSYAKKAAVNGNEYAEGSKSTHKLTYDTIRSVKAIILSIYIIVLAIFIVFPFINKYISSSESFNKILTSFSFLLFLMTLIISGRTQHKITMLSHLAIRKRIETDEVFGKPNDGMDEE